MRERQRDEGCPQPTWGDLPTRVPEKAIALISMRLPSSWAAVSSSWQQAALSAALAAAVAFGPPTAALSAAHAVQPSMTVGALQQQEQTVESLFTTATPSVAFITTFVERTDRLTMNAVEVAAGTGSGFVWDGDNHVRLLLSIPRLHVPLCLLAHPEVAESSPLVRL